MSQPRTLRKKRAERTGEKPRRLEFGCLWTVQLESILFGALQIGAPRELQLLKADINVLLHRLNDNWHREEANLPYLVKKES